MHKTYLAPGQLLRSVYMEKSYLGKAGNTSLKVAPGQQKTHVNMQLQGLDRAPSQS